MAATCDSLKRAQPTCVQRAIVLSELQFLLFYLR